MPELSRSIFAKYANGGTFQFTRAPEIVVGDDRWLMTITAPTGERWNHPALIDDAEVLAALADATNIIQYD